jgi:uncharacterized membrane protein YdjX (TVP38/TMEM64 family)/predicted enzyme related to lactoylglutathione lyase
MRGLVTEQPKKKPNYVGIALILLALAALFAVYFWLKATDRLGMFSSAEAFREWLGGFGAWAPIMFLLLQFAQVLAAPIPGEVTSVAGGLMFGFWRGMAMSALGIAAGSLVAFALARKFGRPLAVKLAGGAVVEKYMDTVNRNSTWLLFAMFLLPFFPKDALSYVAGLTGIAWPVFVVIAFVGRLPGQVVSTLVGSGMISIPWWGWGIIILISAGLVYLSFKYSEKISDRLMGIMKKRVKAKEPEEQGRQAILGNGAKYAHTNLIARDWQSLAQFYIDVFLCKSIPPERHLSGEWIDAMTGIPGVRVEGAHLALPGCEGGPTLEIFSYEPQAEGDEPAINRPGFGHIAFHVDDVRAAVQNVMEHGGGMLGEIVEKDYEELGRLTAAYARDPEGNIIEIQNWNKGSA